MEFTTKVGDKKDTFITGAVRGSQEGKPRFDLIGVPFMYRLASLLARGAAHYGERNWEKGQNVSRTFASMYRHMIAYQEGERTEDHLAAIAFNVMSIIHVENGVLDGKLPRALLDLPFYENDPNFTEPVMAAKYPDYQFNPMTDLEAVALAYMDKAQKQNTVGIYWFDFHTVWRNTLPTLSEAEFADIMRGLIEKGFLQPEIVPHKVHPDYALAGYISYLHEQELARKLREEEPKAEWDYDSTEIEFDIDFEFDDADENEAILREHDRGQANG